MAKIHNANALTGGTSGCLDYIDVANEPILDGDPAFVFNSSYKYVYNANASSGAAESSPTVIKPDYSAGVAYTGNLRFILLGMYQASAALQAISALTPAANTLPYYTSASAAALADLTAFARTILDDATAGAMLARLGIYKTVVNYDYTATAALATGTTNIAYDDTIPQITE